MSRFHLSDQPIDSAMLGRALGDARAGACVTFEGWVRNENAGRSVQRLDYQAYVRLPRPRASASGERCSASRSSCGMRASGRRAGNRRTRRLGWRERCASRRGICRMPLHHRRGQAARADLEERALCQRRIRLAASGQYAGDIGGVAVPPATSRHPNRSLPLLPSGPGGVCKLSSRENQRDHHRLFELRGRDPQSISLTKP